jgi:hypothetical protein
MIRSGESHSDTSAHMLVEALDALDYLDQHNAPADLPAVAGKVRRDVGLSQILWEHEDELPEMSDDEFSAIFPASRLSEGSCGVRVYPFVKDAAGNKIFISEPNAGGEN